MRSMSTLSEVNLMDLHDIILRLAEQIGERTRWQNCAGEAVAAFAEIGETDIVLEAKTRRVLFADQAAELTPTQFAIVELVERSPIPLTSEDIADRLDTVEGKTVREHIRLMNKDRLRPISIELCHGEDSWLSLGPFE